ncbi:MAG: hypothetical protein JZD40_00810 [Sulfolobus sp.]|nr:hypothetical protein [Sulfolobus sp.]
MRVYSHFFPVKGKRIWFIPLTLTYLKENGTYEVYVDHSTFIVSKGEEDESYYSEHLKRAIQMVMDFARLCKCYREHILPENIHPLYRKGKVKLKYVWDDLMPMSEAKELLNRYYVRKYFLILRLKN